MHSLIPLVSVVITSYNRATWVGKAIESAQAQDYQNIEIIVCDNASTDDSDAVIKKFSDNDGRIRYVRNENNIGMISNFEKVFFQLAKGNFIINISSDDYLINPTFISSAIKLVNKYTDVYLVFGKWVSLIEKEQKIIPSPCPVYYQTEYRKGLEAFFDFPDYPYFGWGGCLLDRRKLINENLHFTGKFSADVEINLYLMQLGNVGYVNEDTYVIRSHGNNAIASLVSASKFIDDRLNLYEQVYSKYCKLYQSDEKIKNWKTKLLKKDILEVSLTLMLQNKREFKIFIDYAEINYPGIVSQIKKSKKWILRKRIFVPILRNNLIRKIVSLLFPTKMILRNAYQNG